MVENKVNTLDENFVPQWFVGLATKKRQSLLEIIQALADSIGPLSFTEIKEYSHLGDNALSDGLKLLENMRLINKENEKYVINKDGINFFNEANLAGDRLNTESFNKFQKIYESSDSKGIPNFISNVSISNLKSGNDIYPSGDSRIHQSVELLDSRSQGLIDEWHENVFLPGIFQSLKQFPVAADAFRFKIILTKNKTKML